MSTICVKHKTANLLEFEPKYILNKLHLMNAIQKFTEKLSHKLGLRMKVRHV